MLIRIKQIRLLADGKGHGSDVLLGKGKDQRTLEFRPLDPKKPEQDHVCDVSSPEDLATLLAIPSGFEVHPSALAAPRKAAAKASTASAAASSSASSGEGQAGKGVDELSREELLAAVAKKTGKKPSPATSTKKLKALLAK